MFKTKAQRTSLEVQWLRLHAPSAQHPGLIPVQGTRSHMPHRRLKILRATTKTQHSQIKKQINKYFFKKRKEKLRNIMYILLSGTPLRLQVRHTKELGVHTNEQFQMACCIVAWSQRTCYKCF